MGKEIEVKSEIEVVRDFSEFSRLIEEIRGVSDDGIIFIDDVFYIWRKESYPDFLRYFSSLARGGVCSSGFLGLYVVIRDFDGGERVWLLPLGSFYLLDEWGRIVDEFLRRSERIKVRELWERGKSGRRTEFVKKLRWLGYSGDEIDLWWRKRESVIWMDERFERGRVIARHLGEVIDVMKEDEWVKFSVGIEETGGVKEIVDALQGKRVCVREGLNVFPVLLRMYKRWKKRERGEYSDVDIRREFWKAVDGVKWFPVNYVRYLIKGKDGDTGIDWFGREESVISFEWYKRESLRERRRRESFLVKDLRYYWELVNRRGSDIRREYDEVFEELKSRRGELVYIWDRERGCGRYVDFMSVLKKGLGIYRKYVLMVLSEMRERGMRINLEGLERGLKRYEEIVRGGGSDEDVEKARRRYEILYDIYRWCFDLGKLGKAGGSGKVYPLYDTYGTRTGRVITRYPCIFRLMKDEEGEVIDGTGFDYSQMELRIAFSVFGFGGENGSESENGNGNGKNELIKVLEEDDFYRRIGEGDRERGKVLCLKMLYGEEEKVEGEEDVVKRFEEELRRVKRGIGFELGRIKYVGSLTGRIRKIDEDERRVGIIVNSMIQGVASDYVFMVVRDMLMEFDGVEVLGINQDCVYLKLKSEEEEKRVRDYMERRMEEIAGVPFEVKRKW